jgi:hypothetical protein
VFTPVPLAVLGGIDPPKVRRSLHGLLWYTCLPLVGLAIWHHRRNAAMWTLFAILVGHLVVLSSPGIAFGGDPTRGRLASAPAFAMLAASGYVAYRRLDLGGKSKADLWLMASACVLLIMMGLYTFLI